MPKVTLLDDVIVPKEGTHESTVLKAGETVDLDQAVVDRLEEKGVVAKPNSKEAKAAKEQADDDE